jgi:hypothetical protein
MPDVSGCWDPDDQPRDLEGWYRYWGSTGPIDPGFFPAEPARGIASERRIQDGFEIIECESEARTSVVHQRSRRPSSDRRVVQRRPLLPHPEQLPRDLAEDVRALPPARAHLAQAQDGLGDTILLRQAVVRSPHRPLEVDRDERRAAERGVDHGDALGPPCRTRDVQ